MTERVYVDATDVFSFYQYEMMYSGKLKVLAKGRSKTFVFDERSDYAEPNKAVFDTLIEWGFLDDDHDDDPYDYDPIGCEYFVEIDIKNSEIETFKALDWVEEKCQCACGQDIAHKHSPIPPQYTEEQQ